MDWQAIGAIGEIVGALAVVVTLGFLVRQLRQSTAAIRTQTYDSVMSGYNEINLLIGSRADLAELFERGQDDPEALGDTEKIQFVFLLGSVVNQTEKVLRMFQAGALDDEEWHRFASHIEQIMSTPGGQAFQRSVPAFSHVFAELDKHRVETPIVDHRLGGAEQRDA